MAENDASVEIFVRKAYDSLKEGRPSDALSALDEALKIDFEHSEVLYALKCLNWWIENLGGLDDRDDPYGRGLNILSQWKNYYNFLEKIGNNFDSCQYAIRRFVFSAALEALKQVQNDGMDRHNPELLLNLGRCYKGIGNYEAASEYLGKAAGFRREDAAALSEFADVNALLGETTAAKALFREAFYVDPQAVDINAMESELIKNLAAHTRDEGKTGKEINEWLPVYGILTGVFSVARKLNPLEASKLVQSVKSLENDLRTNPKNEPELMPRLLNKYLWLMSHYEMNKDKNAVAEIVLKIRIYDSAIYERYIK
ncbi:MAG: hypothetical protein LBC53_06465 [Spirochaetaceae bacterium]|jgi:tetratricopeptide (TPR) repeat protein|nr:hypothetical protein [Spirochaetaceae bacterium]